MSSTTRRGAFALHGFDLDDLMRRATQRTGLHDFGDPTFREPLAVLVQSFHREVAAGPAPHLLFRKMVDTFLANRLRLAAALRADPRVADERIVRPVFIVGLPRSGTTLLHHLLARDPANRTLALWETMHSVPAPDSAAHETDERVAATARDLATASGVLARLFSLHALDARQPEECFWLTANDFASALFMMAFDVPSYRAWYLSSDLGWVYERHRLLLQWLQSRERGARWVLKSPAHLQGMAWLLRAYPDARVIVVHRDPVRALTSTADVATALRGALYEGVRPDRVGRELLEELAGAHARAASARRDAETAGSEARFVDVHFEDLVRDPLVAAEAIYAALDLPLMPEARARLCDWLAAHGRSGARAGRPPEAAEYGLDAREIRARFTPARASVVSSVGGAGS